MRKVVLYIAVSLDGYIAKKDGNVDWLNGDGSDTLANSSYPRFIKTVDTVIMGYTTYRQIVTELMPEAWPYDGKETYVLTHRKCALKSGISFVDTDITSLIQKLQNKPGKDIWICGGADIVKQCIEENIIDNFQVTVIPVLLGSGIRLFKENSREIKLRLVSTKKYGGMVDLIYERKSNIVK